MRRILSVMLIATFVLTSSLCYAAEKKSSSDIMKEGLLGAGAGAVGGLASGAEGGDVWKGALAGAGVNIIGGALLDSMTGEKVGSVKSVESVDSKSAFGMGYKEGFNNGYKQGYKEGLAEGTKSQ
ncbi:MAG: hypothetical protein JSV93_05990 [Candidatus Omnitrophota bacterium]|nr:MAG: hypothetical protein JSV93_05990 [Candidatus Omnitrophota bacterium]